MLLPELHRRMFHNTEILEDREIDVTVVRTIQLISALIAHRSQRLRNEVIRIKEVSRRDGSIRFYVVRAIVALVVEVVGQVAVTINVTGAAVRDGEGFAPLPGADGVDRPSIKSYLFRAGETLGERKLVVKRDRKPVADVVL